MKKVFRIVRSQTWLMTSTYSRMTSLAKLIPYIQQRESNTKPLRRGLTSNRRAYFREDQPRQIRMSGMMVRPARDQPQTGSVYLLPLVGPMLLRVIWILFVCSSEHFYRVFPHLYINVVVHLKTDTNRYKHNWTQIKTLYLSVFTFLYWIKIPFALGFEVHNIRLD